jgi:hypothetical protein
MNARSFDLLIADSQFAFRDGLHAQSRMRNPQTPTVVIGNTTAEPAEARNGQTMYLARPFDRALLVCFVSMAIAEGRPVRRSERKPVNRFAAIANGVPSHIIDVSNEGMRLEVPFNRTALPPYFNVHVPNWGVAVSVQRMWTRLPAPEAGRNGTTWYGGALALNRARAEQAWRTIVETIPLPGRASVRFQVE